jgi:F-type H+-transporting ATPase subunit epsilon
MENLKLEIITPSGKIFSDDVESVLLPGSEGEFGVLKGHSSLISLLTAGIIEVKTKDGHEESVAVDWGYAEVSENGVVVLADGAVAISGENESDIAKSIASAKELLRAAHDSDMAISSVEARIESAAKGKL